MTTGPVFDQVARRYDLVNRFLSLGRDGAWRRSAIAHLPHGRILDLGAGTGAANDDFGSRRVVAVDPSAGMLRLNPADRRVLGVGEHLPFENESFDAVFSAYVFRNLDSVDDTLGEIHRVLRPGGAAGIVDLGRPAKEWKARLHRAGSSVVLPLAGRLAGSREEYEYLHRSLDKLPQPAAMFGGRALQLERLWRMGPLGFVYGVILRKAPAETEA